MLALNVCSPDCQKWPTSINIPDAAAEGALWQSDPINKNVNEMLALNVWSPDNSHLTANRFAHIRPNLRMRNKYIGLYNNKSYAIQSLRYCILTYTSQIYFLTNFCKTCIICDLF
jgi:hypothetical protein